MRTTDNVDLRRTLSLIDYERTLRMRELDIERRQFLHHRHHDTLPKKISEEQSLNRRREELRIRIAREKTVETENQVSLLKRKAELLEKVKALKTSNRRKIDKLMWLADEVEKQPSRTDQDEERERENHNHVANLYQRGFDLLRKKKEENQNPLVASVNTILQKLRAEKETTDKKGDPFSMLSKSIMNRFDIDEGDPDAGDDNMGNDQNIGTRTSSGEGKASTVLLNDEQMTEKPKDKCYDQMEDDENVGMSHINKPKEKEIEQAPNGKVNGTSPMKKPLQRKSSRALNLWAAVQREQKAVAKLSSIQQDSKQSSIGSLKSLTEEDGAGKIALDGQKTKSAMSKISNYNKSSCESPNPRLSPKKGRFEQASPDRTSSQSNSTQNEPLVSERKNHIFKNGSIAKKEIQQESSTIDASSETAPSVVYSPRKDKISQLERESNKGKHGLTKIVITDECIEECDETTPANTVIVVHDDHGEDLPPIQWDRGYRYSMCPSDNEILTDDFFNKFEDNDRTQDDITLREKADSSIDGSGDTDDELKASISRELNQISKNKEAPEWQESQQNFNSQRSEVLNSAMSLTMQSEVPSNTISSDRPRTSDQGRLSMQTRGSLRALSGIMREEARRQTRNENMQSQSLTYNAIVDALAGAAAEANQQSQKLENIRRAGLGLKPVERDSKVKDKSYVAIGQDGNTKVAPRNMRRNTIHAPGSSADVTDPVYKFLHRRSHSKTLRKHTSLSKVELKLLAHAPGEDITGRRHSFSSQQSSRRSSSSVLSVENLRRMSASTLCSRKASADLSIVLENETNQSQGQRDSLSFRTGAESTTRPHSVAISEASRPGSRISCSLRLPATKESRSYSWAPDVSETSEWHVLAMELLARTGNRVGKFRSVSDMLQWLGDEYRKQTSAMLYEELRYCSYLRLPKHQQPSELTESDISSIFASECPSPN